MTSDTVSVRPLFAQIVSYSAALAAVRATASDMTSILIDSMIDNIRLSSDDPLALSIAWAELLQILARLGVIVRESTSADSYEFLGMYMNHLARTVRPADKTLLKLREARSVIRSRTSLLIVDIQALFGVCVFASTAVDFPLATVYFVFKFMRRLVARIRCDAHLVTAAIWPAVIPIWIDWIDNLLQAHYHAETADPTTRHLIAFTDAPDVGCGAVVFNLAATSTTTIFARSWSAAESALQRT
jgi:hypothetical protein